LKKTDEEVGNLDKPDRWTERNLTLLRRDCCRTTSGIRINWGQRRSAMKDLAGLGDNEARASSVLWH